ncbi:MAG TPA: acyl-CoA dehydrogenase family protein, partial [Candidatus Limnocylindrales bacterium]|nr:acyl-CoA dehydrogenase family protein [Candidatus Limnocylindrales bacterium]
PTPTYRLTEDQLAMRDAVRVLADDQIAPRAADIDRTAEFPWDVKELLASHDVLSLPFPEAYGGLGGDLLTVCLAVEQISRVCATSGLILAVQELASLPLLLAGTDAQKERWFPDLAAGRKLIAFALTEAEAGSDVASARTRARRDGDGDDADWIIDGSKRFISQGSVADLIAVFAVTADDDGNAPGTPVTPRHQRLTCFIVEKDMPGFTVERVEHKMGIRGSPTAELGFRGVRVPDANRVGEVGEGFSIAMRTLDRSRPGIAAQAVGIAQGALDVAAAYARERKQFGKPIAEFQMIAAMLADMDAQTEAARQLLYKAATEIDAGAPDAGRWSAMCKLVAGDTAMRVTTDAVQVLGGYGYIDEFPVERMMRDAKITQLYEGTQQIQRLVIARALTSPR